MRAKWRTNKFIEELPPYNPAVRPCLKIQFLASQTYTTNIQNGGGKQYNLLVATGRVIVIMKDIFSDIKRDKNKWKNGYIGKKSKTEREGQRKRQERG